MIKSAWGIRISITASVVPQAGRASTQGGNGFVDVRFAGATESLPENLKRHVRRGLSAVGDEIVQALGGAKALVTIEDISYNEADFQAEGLEVAVIRWAEQELGLPRREIVEGFDKEKNRYLFGFDRVKDE
ncbi:hypothetical protein [Actinoplanes sp. NPDC048796]|uniref:hypothetical protein n=1 Tax=unclassified Actinoplanes TaxID=2626549 RepID=UPI0033E69CCF